MNAATVSGKVAKMGYPRSKRIAGLIQGCPTVTNGFIVKQVGSNVLVEYRVKRDGEAEQRILGDISRKLNALGYSTVRMNYAVMVMEVSK